MRPGSASRPPLIIRMSVTLAATILSTGIVVFLGHGGDQVPGVGIESGSDGSLTSTIPTSSAPTSSTPTSTISTWSIPTSSQPPNDPEWGADTNRDTDPNSAFATGSSTTTSTIDPARTGTTEPTADGPGGANPSGTNPGGANAKQSPRSKADTKAVAQCVEAIRSSSTRSTIRVWMDPGRHSKPQNLKAVTAPLWITGCGSEPTVKGGGKPQKTVSPPLLCLRNADAGYEWVAGRAGSGSISLEIWDGTSPELIDGGSSIVFTRNVFAAQGWIVPVPDRLAVSERDLAPCTDRQKSILSSMPRSGASG